MILIKLTKSDNTLIRASYPYGRGNIKDKFLFSGVELYRKLETLKTIEYNDLPHWKEAFRKYWHK